MDQQETRPLPEMPPVVLSYRRPSTRTGVVRRPWHVFVTLAICWVPVALTPVLVAAEIWAVLQGNQIEIVPAVLATVVAGALAALTASLSYQAIVRPLRHEAEFLGRLAIIFGIPLTLFALSAITSMDQFQSHRGRDLGFTVAAGGLWFVAWSMWCWGRQLARAFPR